MQSKFIASVLVSTLAISGAVASTAQAQVRVNESGTTFFCVRSGGDFATIAERNGRRTAPVFVWRTREFGRDYTPEQRCNLVTERLNAAVEQNGGRLRNLLLTTGTVNRYPVVCYVNSDRERCNNQNLLFTLDNRNRQNPDRVLSQLLQFGVTGAGDPVVSLVPTNPTNTTRLRRGYYSLNDAVTQALQAAEDEENDNSNNGGGL